MDDVPSAYDSDHNDTRWTSSPSIPTVQHHLSTFSSTSTPSRFSYSSASTVGSLSTYDDPSLVRPTTLACIDQASRESGREMGLGEGRDAIVPRWAGSTRGGGRGGGSLGRLVGRERWSAVVGDDSAQVFGPFAALLEGTLCKYCIASPATPDSSLPPFCSARLHQHR
jgi:hypothetical protein